MGESWASRWAGTHEGELSKWGPNGFESIVASMSLAENRLLVYAMFDTTRKGTTIMLASRVSNKLSFC